MKVIIFGDYEKWAAAVDLIERKCTDVTVVGCCDPFRPQLSDHFSAAYTTQQMGDAFMEGEIDGVKLSISNYVCLDTEKSDWCVK
ncbi:MAG: hypothetical protein K6E50_00800 [Lachnospiraceae bacterium]|nr:hypothetical protein [Lachnospiraceae bacterium]